VKVVYVIIINIIFAFDLFSLKYAFKNYTNSDGLPQAQVISITQDSIGRIWVSTHCGIAYYDGYHFNTINKKMGLPTNYVYNIIFKNGKIFGGGSGSIFELDPFNENKVNNFKISNVVRNFYPQENYFLFATDEGLFIFRDNKILKILSKPPGRGRNIFFKEKDGFYYLSKNSIYKIRNDFFVEKLIESNLNFNTFAIKGDEILIGAEEGFFSYKNGKLLKLKDLPPVNDILVDFENVWLATNDGLYLIKKDTTSYIGKENGISSNEIYCLFKDRENILWIGTDTGLSKLQSLAFENFVSEKGLFSGSIWAFLEMEDGRILIGGDKGLGIYENGEVQEIKLKGFEKDSIRAFEYYKNKIIIAFRNKGIYSLSLNGGIKIERFLKEEIQGVFSIFFDKNENLWVSTRNGLYLYKKDKKKFFNKNNGLLDDTVFKVLEAPDGKIIALTDNGISEYDGEKFKVPEKYGSLLGYSVRSIFFDQDKIWVATLGNGLFLYENNNWEKITEDDGFPSDNLWSIAKDDLGFLWIGSNKGIIMYAKGYSCLYNTNDGLKGDEATLSGILKTRDGNIWFGITNGALKLNPYKIEPNMNPPNLYFEKVETDKRVLVPKDEIYLKPSEKRISIYFNGLSFQDEKEIYYSYRLYPLEGWSKPIQERKVVYANLKPGSYSFQIKSCNASWIWNNEPITLHINKTPYFYEKTSFKILSISFLLFIFYLFFKIRTRAIHKEKERLEKTVNEKTKELQEKLKELYILSTTDFLTKVFNRGHFEKLLREEIKRAKRENKTLGLAILDLDHFKDLNDEFGHSVGDDMLVEFGKILKNTFRTTDIIARYGGDEFVILFVSTEPEGCIQRLKTLMEKVKGFVYESEEKKVQLSLSVGITFVSFEEGKNIDIATITRKADNALYEAKNKGRDSIVVYYI